jgi:hypothetical protein
MAFIAPFRFPSPKTICERSVRNRIVAPTAGLQLAFYGAREPFFRWASRPPPPCRWPALPDSAPQLAGELLRRRQSSTLARNRRAAAKVLYRNTTFPGLKHPLLAFASNVTSHWETSTFPLSGGLSVIALAIRPADLPAPVLRA